MPKVHKKSCMVSKCVSWWYKKFKGSHDVFYSARTFKNMRSVFQAGAVAATQWWYVLGHF